MFACRIKGVNYWVWKKLKTKIQSSQSLSSTSTLVSLGYCRTPFLPPTSEATFLGHRKLQPSATCKGQRREVWLVMDWWPFVYAKHFLSPHLTVTSSVFHHLHHLRSSDQNLMAHHPLSPMTCGNSNAHTLKHELYYCRQEVDYMGPRNDMDDNIFPALPKNSPSRPTSRQIQTPDSVIFLPWKRTTKVFAYKVNRLLG